MRIGLLLNILDEEYQLSFYRGMAKRAKEMGIELVCFQRDNVSFSKYSSAFPKSSFFALDGLIVLTSVIVDKFEIKNRLEVQKLWGDIPVISVGQKIEGVPSIISQSEKAMKELVNHLIDDHSYRNFVFIGGREKHQDTIEREYVFCSTIDSLKIKYPELNYCIIRGDFTEESAIHAISEHVEKNHARKIDSIICANDNMAIGVNKYIKINHPDCIDENCAVTGFDDIPQASLEYPPLTTVRQPMDDMGVKALDTIVNVINGKEVKMVDYIDSEFIIRGSCGCNYEQNRISISDLKMNMAHMQYNYLRSEQQLRLLSHMCQDLNSVYSIQEMRSFIDRNLQLFDIRDFCILSFTENKKSVSSYVYPLYVRKNGVMDSKYYLAEKIQIKDFLLDFSDWSDTYAFKYLYLGSSTIGGILYKAKEDLHPYICSVSINIAQTINRLKMIEEEFKHADKLEKEVQKRTKELVESNNRRIEVEAQVLRVSEAERQRFSTDLHDDICQRLAGISMLCKSYARKSEPVEKSEMNELVELITDTLQRTRQYAHNSYPVELESLGMNHSLNNLCASFEVQSGIKCNYEWNLQKNLDFTSLQKLNIFRIIQESLHNVMKHSKADTVTVSIDSVKDYVIVGVRDNGIGISNLENVTDKQKKSSGNGGLGLNSMQYRADQIGAMFEIKPNLPKGTCVELKIFP